MHHQLLQRDGYVVVPTTCFGPAARRDLLDEASRFPEFKPATKKFVMGGFGACGNPSSFHNPTVRTFRQWAQVVLVVSVFKPLVETFEQPQNWLLDQMFDRMTIRVKGEKPSKESWHRDEAGDLIAKGDDKVYGGYVNLDSTDQFFSCVPGTHELTTTQHRGFAKIDCKRRKIIKDEKLAVKVRIPPGSILLFNEKIEHEVLAKKARITLVRLHLAFRLTRSVDVRPPDLLENMQKQAVMMIKSGQIPPMHAKLHWVNHVGMLAKWSARSVHPRCLVKRAFKSGPRKGEMHDVCVEHMKSLQEYGFPVYVEYTESEVTMHSPSRQWTLLAPGSTSDYVDISL